MSKRVAAAQPKRLAYVNKVCELSRRGDIFAVAELMQGYYSDKTNHPWDMIFSNIEKYWTQENPKRDVTETLVLLRDAVFGAFDILSLSIALEIPTSEIIKLFAKESSWKDARREVRNKCTELVRELIRKKKTRFLVPSALQRDGFGFLVSEIENTELEIFRKAKPRMMKDSKLKKQVLDLKQLEKSKLGSKFLKEQMVMETILEKNDPRISTIVESYEQFLIELEVDLSSSVPEPVLTEQVTLNGTPIGEVDSGKLAVTKRILEKDTQPPLTDFIEEKQTPKKRKTKKSPRQKKRGSKKK